MNAPRVTAPWVSLDVEGFRLHVPMENGTTASFPLTKDAVLSLFQSLLSRLGDFSTPEGKIKLGLRALEFLQKLAKQ